MQKLKKFFPFICKWIVKASSLKHFYDTKSRTMPKNFLCNFVSIVAYTPAAGQAPQATE
jgi:hypothetical protein